jgi:O-antigen/teichoic acid export membrane protein
MRNVLTLLGGTALAQVLPLLLTPLLTRLYAPEAFGALALLLAVVNPLALLASGRLELTVPLPKEDASAQALVRAGMAASIFSFVVVALIVVFAHGPVERSFSGVQLPEVMPFIPLLLLAMSLFQPLNHWLIRRSAFRAMSVNKVVQMAIISVSSVVLGVLYWPTGMLLGYTLGWGVNVVMVYFQARAQGFHVRPFDLQRIRSEASHYRNFPLFNALPAVLHTAALSVPVFLLSAAAGDDITGQFNLSRQVVFLPSTFIAVAFAQVYMQRAAHAVVMGHHVMVELKATLRLLSLLAIAMAITLLAAGPELFALVFGEQWEQAGRFARILAIPIAVQFMVIPLAVVLPALGMIKAYSIWQVGYFGVVLVFSLTRLNGPEEYLIGLAVLETLCYVALLALILRSARRHDARVKAPDHG